MLFGAIMQLYIPGIGDQLILEQDWSFMLHYEVRNASLYAHLGFQKEALDLNSRNCISPDPLPIPVFLPAGVILKVDRLYIRKGQGDFDSITFVAPGIKVQSPFYEMQYTHTNGIKTYEKVHYTKNVSLRFWVKLEDANKIIFKK